MKLKQKLFILSSFGILGLAWLMGVIMDMPSVLVFVFIISMGAGFVMSELAKQLSINLEGLLKKKAERSEESPSGDHKKQ